jgi:hypothetical protein
MDTFGLLPTGFDLIFAGKRRQVVLASWQIEYAADSQILRFQVGVKRSSIGESV